MDFPPLYSANTSGLLDSLLHVLQGWLNSEDTRQQFLAKMLSHASLRQL